MAEVKAFNDPALKLSLAVMYADLYRVAPGIFDAQQIAVQQKQALRGSA